MLGKVSENKIIFQNDALKSFQDGDIVDCTVMSARQKNHLDMMHAVCSFAYHNWRDGRYKSYEEFRQFLSIEVGYTKVSVTYIAGKLMPIIIAESWGYRVSEKKFMAKLFNPVMSFLCDYFKCDFDTLCSMSQEHKFLSNGKLNEST